MRDALSMIAYLSSLHQDECNALRYGATDSEGTTPI